MTREVKYIGYHEQDAYREAGWKIDAFTHSHHKNYSLIASREEQMDETEKLLAERGKIYGDFGNICMVAQGIKTILVNPLGTSGFVLNTSQREALDMIATKLARIVCGDPSHADNWKDIAGYATLALRECEKRSGEEKAHQVPTNVKINGVNWSQNSIRTKL